MAVLARTNATNLSTSPNMSARIRSRLPRSSSRAVRNYWSSRHPGGAKHGTCGAYNYMRPYPQRGLPQYNKHVSSIEHDYMRGVYQSRRQSRRDSSHWAPEEDARHPANKSKRSNKDGEEAQERRTGDEKGNAHNAETFWQAKVRLAGEHHARLMEEQMRMMRKDPYWGLFGRSEMHGVWNPWRKHYEMHERMLKDIWATKPTSDKTEARPSNEKPVAVQAEPKTKHTPAEEVDEVEYRFDPVSNRRVPRERQQVPPSKVEAPPSSALSESRLLASRSKLSSSGKDAATAARLSAKLSKFSSSSSSSSSENCATTAPSSSQHGQEVERAGFAKQPWLVQEGFLSSKQDVESDNPKESADETSATVSGTNEKTVPVSRTEVDSRPSASGQVRYAAGESTSPARLRLVTSINQRLGGRSLVYDETPDKREDLDLLRASDVRAASGKIITKAAESQLSRQQRWREIESLTSRILAEREERLNAEYAADQWELKRTWSAYPGYIPKTVEERRARRRLLERAFTSSLNKFEHDMNQILGIGSLPHRSAPSISSTADGQDLSIHSTASMRNVAKYIQSLREQITAKKAAVDAEMKAAKRQRADAMLQEEARQQKVAMLAGEERPKYFKTSVVASAAEQKPSDVVNELFKKEMNARMSKPAESKLENLKQEIRSIFEDSYGPIGAQVSKSSASQVQNQISVPEVIRSPANSSAKTTSPGTIQSDLGTKIEASEPAAAGSGAQAGHGTTHDSSVDLAQRSTASHGAVQKLQNSAADLGPSMLHTGDGVKLVSARNEALGRRSYILLAFDPDEKKIKVLRTTSSRYEDSSARRTIDSILGRLDNPVAYFKHIERLEKAGYELVAGGKDMLVYKDALGRGPSSQIDLPALTLTATEAESPPSIRPSTSPAPRQRGMRREPSSTTEDAAAKKADGASGDGSLRVRRLEDRFSGPGPRFKDAPPFEEQTDERRGKGVMKRVVWRVGAVVAAIYAFGVFMEWSKERDRELLTREYQQEVRRVRELERNRALEEKNAASRWGF